jgi:hypothetical protein
MIFFDFSSDTLSFVLGIFSFFNNQLSFGTFWKSKQLRQVLIISMFVFENFFYFFEVLYTLFILEYKLLILTVVVSTLSIHEYLSQLFTFPKSAKRELVVKK